MIKRKDKFFIVISFQISLEITKSMIHFESSMEARPKFSHLLHCDVEEYSMIVLYPNQATRTG